MLHIIENSILNRLTIVVFCTVILAACSNKAMYQTGKALDSIAAPRSPAAAILGLVTAPLKQNQEEEDRKISEENRRILEEKKLRKQAEYIRWFKSLSKEDQCDLLAASPKDPQKKSKGVEFDKINTSFALPACKNALNKSPNNARLQFQYGRVLDRAKKYRAAISWYEKASRNGYNLANYSLGVLYHLDLNDSKRALPWYTKAASKGNWEAVYYLGRIYNDQKKYDLAEKMYLKAAKQGKDANAMWDLAVLYQDTGQHGKKGYWLRLARDYGSQDAIQYYNNSSYSGGNSWGDTGGGGPIGGGYLYQKQDGTWNTTPRY